MKLFAFIVSENETRMSWKPDTWSGEGWHEIEREPDLAAGEYLEIGSDSKTIVIKKREKGPAEIAAEAKASEDRDLLAADTIRDLRGRIEAIEAKLGIGEGKMKP